MMNVQSVVIDRRHNCSALRTSAIESPCIEPDLSTRNTISAAAGAASKAGTNPTAIARSSPWCSDHAHGVRSAGASTVRMKSRSRAVRDCRFALRETTPVLDRRVATGSR
jgi:hypothetical protein